MTCASLLIARPVIRSSVPVLVAFAALACAAVANAKGTAVFGCHVNLPNSTGYIPSQPTYFSAVFTAPDMDGGMFSLYVEKKYAAHPLGGVGCMHSWSREGVENAMQRMMAQVKASGHTVIETGWTYDKHAALMAELAKNPPPPPAAAAPAAATPAAKAGPAQSAYEKALEAQRPASNAPTQVAAAPKAAVAATKPADAEGEKYSFCYCVGSTAGSRPSYYVTPVFVSSSVANPQGAFGKQLHAAHPRENLGGTVCSRPQSMEATQTARRNEENKARVQYDIVEVPWQL